MPPLSLLVPIGVVGFFRWMLWLIRRVPAALYKSYESDHTATLTVVSPVYQEDPVIFAAAIESWLANDVDEVICVIDATDERSIEIARRYPVTVIVTDVPGKRDALRRGWEAATTDLVALVDSDTLWARDVRAEVVKPFADPKMGGVGTRQNVLNPANFWQHMNDMYLDYRYFDEIASQTRVGQAVSCLSGRTAIYRRSLLLDISADFMNEQFMGVPCNSGEDKRLTTLTLERGYRTYLQRSARVWSTFPKQLAIFYRQRLRWSRNTWRSDLRALGKGWIYRHRFLALTTIDKAIGSFTLLASPVFMGWAISNRAWAVAGLLALWWVVSRAAKHLPHLHRHPLHFFLIPGFVLVSFTVALTKIYALLTIRKQRWLTRDVEVIGGHVVRTGVDADATGRDRAGRESGREDEATGEEHVIDLRASVGAADIEARELVGSVVGTTAGKDRATAARAAVTTALSGSSGSSGTTSANGKGRANGATGAGAAGNGAPARQRSARNRRTKR